MIAEVLSPGTYHLDFGDKLREYLTLPTLDTYLSLFQTIRERALNANV